MIKARVEAAIGGHFHLESYPRNIIFSFGEDAVNLLIDPINQTLADLRVRDLRASHWITIQFESDDLDREKVGLFSREALDRVVDLLSALSGEEVRIYYWRTSFTNETGQWMTVARPTTHISKPMISIDLKPFLESKDLTERHYRALRHLRHGLANTSPEKRFSSLLLSVLILSRLFPPDIQKITACRNCGHTISQHGPGERDYLLNLVNVLQGWSTAEINELWRLRNTLLAHGNEHLDAHAIWRLQEASMKTARLAYDTLKASLPNLEISGPAQSWFFQDTFMLMDSGDHAHEGAIDIGIRKGDDENWVATWPPMGSIEVKDQNAIEAIRQTRRLAQESMGLNIRTTEAPTSVRVRIVF